MHKKCLKTKLEVEIEGGEKGKPKGGFLCILKFLCVMPVLRTCAIFGSTIKVAQY